MQSLLAGAQRRCTINTEQMVSLFHTVLGSSVIDSNPASTSKVKTVDCKGVDILNFFII